MTRHRRGVDRLRRIAAAGAVLAVAAALAILAGCPDAGLLGQSYTVSYDANGATSGIAPSDQTKTHGVDLTLATNSGNMARTGYSFEGWNTQADGNGTDFPEAATYDADADLALYAKWMQVYQLSDTGPAGGVVFYDKGAYSEGWRYLEAAPFETEWMNRPWGGYLVAVGPAAQGTAVGTGAANTQAIVTAYGVQEPHMYREDYAAKLCADLSYGGYSDWFLPSKDELNLMYNNLFMQDIGEFVSDEPYWSSSEDSASEAWMENFYDGALWVQTRRNKDLERRVRAARAF